MKVLIVGGGIAGLAMARALEQQGIIADLIERKADGPQEGAGLYLPGNAARALEQLGLLNEIAALAMPIEAQRILDSNGRVLSVTLTKDVWASCGLCLALPRSVLHATLRNSLRDTRLRFDTSISGIGQLGEKSIVSFTDGARSEYDLVIGADGINSTVRQSAFPEVRPIYTGNVCWRFITKDTVGVRDWTVMLGDGTTLLAIPIGNGRVYVYADMAVGEREVRDRVWQFPKDTYLSEFSLPLSPLLLSIPPQNPVHFGRVEQVVMDDWVKGRVVLIGDAAHASSPSMAEEASMAMEDALVLAEALATSDITDALATYMRRRKPRVDWVQKQCAARDKMRRLPSWLRVPLLKLAGNVLYRRSYKSLTEPIWTSTLSMLHRLVFACVVVLVIGTAFMGAFI